MLPTASQCSVASLWRCSLCHRTPPAPPGLRVLAHLLHLGDEQEEHLPAREMAFKHTPGPPRARSSGTPGWSRDLGLAHAPGSLLGPVAANICAFLD